MTINDSGTAVADQKSITVQADNEYKYIYIFEGEVPNSEVWDAITATGTNTYVVVNGQPPSSTPGFYRPQGASYAVAVLLSTDEITLSLSAQ